MSELRITDGFIDDLSSIQSDALRCRVEALMSSIAAFPKIGSPLISCAVIRRFGNGVRKMAVKPFDLLYRFDEDRDLVVFEALVHMKSRR